MNNVFDILHLLAFLTRERERESTYKTNYYNTIIYEYTHTLALSTFINMYYCAYCNQISVRSFRVGGRTANKSTISYDKTTTK